MIKMITAWFQKYFSDPEAAVLFMTLFIITAILIFFGKILTPVIVSLIIAYLLQQVVQKLMAWRVPHGLAVILVFSTFVGLMIIAILGIWPLLLHQSTNLFNELPAMFIRLQDLLMNLPQRFPKYISADLVNSFVIELHTGIAKLGQTIVSITVTSITGVALFFVYFIMVPFLVYFLLMDRQEILDWFKPLLPHNHRLVAQVWLEVREQVGRYILGNLLDILILGFVCYGLFYYMGLGYAALLAALVGISVVIPYIGPIIVSIPVIAVGFVQFGWTPHFAYLVIAYLGLLNLNGNVLMPILFSGVISLHPVAIIIALVFFGGIWGFWGVFFAIPLASLIKAVLNAWPRSLQLGQQSSY